MTRRRNPTSRLSAVLALTLIAATDVPARPHRLDPLPPAPPAPLYPVAGSFFACRCFCGVRDYAKAHAPHSALPAAVDTPFRMLDNSFKFAFDPEPLYVDSVEAFSRNVLTHEKVSKLAYLDDQQRRIREFFSVVAVTRDAVISTAELNLFRGLLQKLPAVAAKLTDMIDALLASIAKLTPAGPAPASLGPNILRDAHTPSPAEIRFQPITAEMIKTHFADRAVCVQMCQTEVVSTSHILKKFYKHNDYGVLKPIGLPPADRHLTPERPEWGFPAVEIPNVRNIARQPSWTASMRKRWEQLYHLAANFDPRTGYITPAVLDNGRSVQQQGPCSSLYASLDAAIGGKVNIPDLRIDVNDWFDPADVDPAAHVAPVADQPYVVRAHGVSAEK